MSKSSTLNKKLQSYSALAGVTLAGVAASGQVVYTDIEPDLIIDELGEFYDLDLNQDGITDFKAEYLNEAYRLSSYGGILYGTWMTGPAITSFAKANSTIGDRWGKGLLTPLVLSDSATIYGKGFSTRPRGILRTSFNKYANGILPEREMVGNFDSVDNKYVGLKFIVNNNVHYGWLRVDVIPNEEDTEFKLVLKDFAYNIIPNSAISAGIGENIAALAPPTNVVATDVSDTYTPQDCEVKWDSSVNNGIVSEYGVVVVKSELADTLTVEDLIEAEGGNGKTLKSSGLAATYTTKLDLGMLDMDGDPVTMGRAYKILVYVIEDKGLYKPSWTLSNEITLSSSNEVASNVVATDAADNKDASDLQVSFDPAADESNIQEYRIIIVRDNAIAGFDSATAALVADTNYTIVAPDGLSKSIVLTPDARDSKGIAITQTNGYHAFVLTVLKSAAGVRLSSPSNKVNLYVPAPKITQISVHDVDNIGDASDVEIRYVSPVSDTLFDEVRFIIMPKNAVLGWTDEKLMQLNSSYSKGLKSFDTLGVMDTVRLNAFTTDGYGSYIEEGKMYTVFPITTSGSATNSKSLGTSAEFMLTSPIDVPTSVFAVNIGTKYNPSDWQIVADIPAKESHVSEYRIIAVPASKAGSFDLALAEAVASGNYVMLTPSGKKIVQVMPADLKDADGASIDKETTYQFFVLAMGNTKASANVLSAASNGVSLVKVSDINEVLAEHGKIYLSHGDIRFELPGLTQTANVFITAINGTSVYNGQLEVGQETLNPGELSAGIYIVNVVSDEVALTRKLLVK